jgi:hypothetical protein
MITKINFINHQLNQSLNAWVAIDLRNLWTKNYIYVLFARMIVSFVA